MKTRINPSNSLIATALLALAVTSSTTVFAQNGTWTQNANGNWSSTAGWAGGTVADGAGNTATFDNRLFNGARTITLDTSRTIGNMEFLTSPGAPVTQRGVFVALGNSTLTFDNNGSTSTIKTTTGNSSGVSGANGTIKLMNDLDVSNGDGVQFNLGPISAGSAGLKTVTATTATNRINSQGLNDGLGQIRLVVDMGTAAEADWRLNTTNVSFSGGAIPELRQLQPANKLQQQRSRQRYGHGQRGRNRISQFGHGHPHVFKRLHLERELAH